RFDGNDRVAIVDTELSVYEGPHGEFGTIFIRGNFKTRARLLVRERPWAEGDPYDAAQVEELRRRIEGIGVTESVIIDEHRVGCGFDDDGPCVVNHVVAITESKDRSLDLAWGFGGATLDPFYGFLRPSFPNIAGFGWDLSLEGHFGTKVPTLTERICDGEGCYERSAGAALVHRRIFGLDPTAEFNFQVQRRVTPARGQIDSALGQARLAWPFHFDRSRTRARAGRRERSRIYDDELRVYAGYLVQIANISKDVAKTTLGAIETCSANESEPCRPPDRGEAIVPDVTAGGVAGLAWERVDNPFNPNDGIVASFDGMIASPWVGGRDWWIRGEVSFRQFIPIPRTDDRLNLRYSLRYGHAIPLPNLPGASTTSIPEVWRYFGGGTTDLGVRGMEPQTMLVDIEETRGPYGAVTLRPTAQGGHIRALATVAVQVVSVSNFLGGKLAHSVFMDLGVLTQNWSQVRPARDVRRSVGINMIKWDISIVTVSLGYAVLLPDSILPGGNVRPTDDRNGRFVFDVGATF
ncbi:MAG: BamA/TamA family outer membrane protein, partial [Nannocystaceae bacterium]|nr:BamA/TamA family outer membrane protein [Nannocystaceae bacterium]